MSLLSKPRDLTVNAFADPVGLGDNAPVFRWKLDASAEGAHSTAWQVQVASSANALNKDEPDLWDSGQVDQPRENACTYAGETLASRSRAFWRVRAWDQDGQLSPWSDVAVFELGLLAREDWEASWIMSPVVSGPRSTPPAPFMRRAFQLKDKPVVARLYVSALGLFECEINGEPVSENVFAPGWTDYSKHVVSHAHDVTNLLSEGDNVLGAILGDGWYSGHIAQLDRQFYGDRPRLLAQLEVTYADGSQERIVSDESWQTRTGPIVANDVVMGEAYDARLELGDWSTPGYDNKDWNGVLKANWPKIPVIPVAGPFVRRHEVIERDLKAEKATGEHDSWHGTTRVLDLGQNITGRVRVHVRGKSGVTLRLRHAEMLQPDGKIYTENLRTALATDYYTLKGEGLEVYEPRFTFHGFQYVELMWQGGEDDIEVEKVEGVVLHSEMPSTGHFQCSHPLLNQLQHNIVWGQKGNFLEVPTDCPQRDERLGWTGDAQVFIRTACFNRDVQPFFHKWMADARDAQAEDGAIPPVIPVNWNFEGGDSGPAWSDANIICPWTIYRCYGDTRILADHYESMQRYIENLVRISKDLVRSHPDADAWGGFGDWLALDGSGKTDGRTLKDLIGTAFLAYDAQLMAEIAEVLGKAEDAKGYRKLHEDVKAVFQRRFVTGEGLIAGNTQTGYVLALHFGLLPEEIVPLAAKELVRLIEKNGTHLATGFVGTPYLCQTLENAGHIDVAYKLLEQETFPSWLFPVKKGATTIWERWDGWTPDKGFQTPGMNSFNHYAYGAIGAWMYGTVAGLELDPGVPGYRRILFRPRPGGSITWAEASLETSNGRASIRWELKDDALQLSLVVPVNSEASLDLPDGYETDQTRFGSGTYQLTARKR